MKRFLLFTLALILFFLGLDHLSRTKKANSCPELSGRMVTREDPEYEKARLVANFNTSKDKFPHTIIFARTTEDVQKAVLYARCHHLPIRIRSGGHNHEGYSTGTDVLLIDVSEMKDVDVDLKTHVATLQPGLTNGELYHFLFKRGLTHAGAASSDVGISGLIMSGGMGPLLRRYGLTCDTLIEAEMVDANGRVIRATKDNEHKDLFFALCGAGGGNFGIVTGLKLQTFPADNVTWFNIFWDSTKNAQDVLSLWQDFFVSPDPLWFSGLDFKFHSLHLFGIYWGAKEDAEEKLAPFLKLGKSSRQIEAVDWKKALELIEEATTLVVGKKPEYKSTGTFVMEKLPEEAVARIDQAFKDTSFPLLNLLIMTMNGKVAEVPKTATAYYYRNAKFFINYSLQWLKPGDEDQAKFELKALREKLLPFTIGDYVGTPDPDLKNYLTDYFGENVERLKCVKRKYDPENVFRFEQSIPPSDQNCN